MVSQGDLQFLARMSHLLHIGGFTPRTLVCQDFETTARSLEMAHHEVVHPHVPLLRGSRRSKSGFQSRMEIARF
jgi:hypothetical protein